MSRLKISVIFLAVLWLGACSMLAPFEDRRRETGVKTAKPGPVYVGKSTPQNPAICYNSLITPYRDVKKLADEVCRREETGTHAVPVRQTVFTCRVLIPNHFYFKCEK